MASKRPTVIVSLNSDQIIQRVFFALVGCEIAIFLLDIAFNHFKLIRIGAVRRLVNITREDGIANFFSSFQMLATGAILLLVYVAVKRSPTPSRKQLPLRLHERGWLILAGFFTFMGFDDGTKFHERMGTTFKKVVKSSEQAVSAGFFDNLLEVFPSYTWQIVFGPMFLAMGIFIVWFLLKEFDSPLMRKMFLGALALYACAVGIDFVEGLSGHPYLPIAETFGTTEKAVRHLSKAVEETIEMFGTTLFLTVFLTKLLSSVQNWTINVRQPHQ